MHFPGRLILVSVSLATSATGAVNGPYAVDADTVHLFHLDEVAGSSVSLNSVPAGASLISFNGATAGAANN
ncbi:MAG: hypothetical protein EOP87_15400, partial [Verrucomicrobiaceae bacterium]